MFKKNSKANSESYVVSQRLGTIDNYQMCENTVDGTLSLQQELDYWV